MNSQEIRLRCVVAAARNSPKGGALPEDAAGADSRTSRPVGWIERLLCRSGGALLRRGGLGTAEDHKQTGIVQGQIPSRLAVGADNPIRTRDEEFLGRMNFAHSFAEEALSIDANGGAVIGVLGPWGSGKTSFVILARSYLEEAGVPVLDFNPWMFSVPEQLVDSFFVELSAQLKLRPGLAKVGKDLEEYGENFLRGGMAARRWILD